MVSQYSAGYFLLLLFQLISMVSIFSYTHFHISHYLHCVRRQILLMLEYVGCIIYSKFSLLFFILTPCPPYNTLLQHYNPLTDHWTRWLSLKKAYPHLPELVREYKLCSGLQPSLCCLYRTMSFMFCVGWIPLEGHTWHQTLRDHPDFSRLTHHLLPEKCIKESVSFRTAGYFCLTNQCVISLWCATPIYYLELLYRAHVQQVKFYVLTVWLGFLLKSYNFIKWKRNPVSGWK